MNAGLTNYITYQAQWFIDLNIRSKMEAPCSDQYGIPWPEWLWKVQIKILSC